MPVSAEAETTPKVYDMTMQKADSTEQETLATFRKDGLDAQQKIYKRAYVDDREDGLDRENII